MRGFDLKIHALVYTDKTCTLQDLMFRVRRDIIIDVLTQVGRNFNNIGLFLKDRFDISRWAPFESLAPLNPFTFTTASAGTSTIEKDKITTPITKFQMEIPGRASHKVPDEIVNVSSGEHIASQTGKKIKENSRFNFLRRKKKTDKSDALSSPHLTKE